MICDVGKTCVPLGGHQRKSKWEKQGFGLCARTAPTSVRRFTYRPALA